jgi:hypothetical protein
MWFYFFNITVFWTLAFWTKWLQITFVTSVGDFVIKKQQRKKHRRVCKKKSTTHNLSWHLKIKVNHGLRISCALFELKNWGSGPKVRKSIFVSGSQWSGGTQEIIAMTATFALATCKKQERIVYPDLPSAVLHSKVLGQLQRSQLQANSVKNFRKVYSIRLCHELKSAFPKCSYGLLSGKSWSC